MQRYIKIGDVTIGQGHKIFYTSIEGLSGGVGISRKQNQYIGLDGGDYGNTLFEVRRVEIRGGILASSQAELEELKNQLRNACDVKNKTDMYYYNGVKTYYAQCYGDSLPEFGTIKYPRWFVEYIAYISIPRFYLLSGDEIYTDLTTDNAFNGGDVVTYPKLVLTCHTESGSRVINIHNTTISKVLSVVIPSGTIVPVGTTINIDMDELQPSILLSNGTNLTNVSSNDFWGLALGSNSITQDKPSYFTLSSSTHRDRFLGA